VYYESSSGRRRGLVGQGSILSSGDILTGGPESDQGQLPGVLCFLAEEESRTECLNVCQLWPLCPSVGWHPVRSVPASPQKKGLCGWLWESMPEDVCVREHVCPPVAVIGSESVSAIGVTMSVSVCERQIVWEWPWVQEWVTECESGCKVCVWVCVKVWERECGCNVCLHLTVCKSECEWRESVWLNVCVSVW
jgi:hypothetical protein